MLRTTALAIVFAAITVAQASFELALVADASPGTFTNSRIHRFDGQTGTYMGQFGKFQGAITDIAIRQSTNDVFAIDGANTLHRYNYNTGLSINVRSTGLPLTNLCISPDGNSLYGRLGRTVYTFSPTTLLQTGSISLSTSFLVFGMHVTHDSVYTYERDPLNGNSYFRRYKTSGVVELEMPVGVWGLPQGHLGEITTESVNRDSYLMIGIGGTNQVIYTFLDAFGAMQAPSSYLPAGATKWLDGTRLHTGGLMIGPDPTPGVGVLAVVGPFGGVLGTTGQAHLVNPVALAAVVAPEPSMFAVMSLGGLLLLRKRKSQ